MDKYTQLKIFLYDHQLQVYIYAFMYVDPETIPVKDPFPYTKKIVNYNKMSYPVMVPKH